MRVLMLLLAMLWPSVAFATVAATTPAPVPPTAPVQAPPACDGDRLVDITTKLEAQGFDYISVPIATILGHTVPNVGNIIFTILGPKDQTRLFDIGIEINGCMVNLMVYPIQVGVGS